MRLRWESLPQHCDSYRHNLPPPAIPADLVIRPAGSADRATLADMSDLIWRHPARAPVWGIQLPESEAETREGWAELADDPPVTVWLAFAGEQDVGSQGYWPVEAGDSALLIPHQCVRLSVAGEALPRR